jgi:hypothetical protein
MATALNFTSNIQQRLAIEVFLTIVEKHREFHPIFVGDIHHFADAGTACRILPPDQSINMVAFSSTRLCLDIYGDH